MYVCTVYCITQKTEQKNLKKKTKVDAQEHHEDQDKKHE